MEREVVWTIEVIAFDYESGFGDQLLPIAWVSEDQAENARERLIIDVPSVIKATVVCARRATWTGAILDTTSI